MYLSFAFTKGSACTISEWLDKNFKTLALDMSAAESTTGAHFNSVILTNWNNCLKVTHKNIVPEMPYYVSDGMLNPYSHHFTSLPQKIITKQSKSNVFSDSFQ